MHHDTYHHIGPEHSYPVRDEWMDRFTVAGSREEVRDKVRNIFQSDIGELTIIPFGKWRESVIKIFAEEIMAKV